MSVHEVGREGDQPKVIVWDTLTNQELATFPETQTVDIGRDSQSIVVGGEHGAKIWTRATGVTRVATTTPTAEVFVDAQQGWIYLVDTSGRLLQCDSRTGEAAILGRDVQRLHGQRNAMALAAVRTSDTLLLDAATGRPIATLPVAGLLAFSPDGRTVATAGDQIQLWQVHTGQELLDLGRYGPYSIHSITFSPDGTLLAAAGGYRDENSCVWIWEAPRKQQRRE